MRIVGTANLQAGLSLVKTNMAGTVWQAYLWRPKGRSDVTYQLERSFDGTTWTVYALSPTLAPVESNEVAERFLIAALGQPGGVPGILARLRVTAGSSSAVTLPIGTQKATFTYKQSYGMVYAPPAVFTGTVFSFSGSLLQCREGEAARILSSTSSPGAWYVEFVEGPLEGHRIDLDLTQSSGSSLALNFSGPASTTSQLVPGIGGSRFVVRRLKTLDEVFPKNTLAGTSSPSTANKIHVWNGTSWTIYWRCTFGSYDCWTDITDASFSDYGSTPLIPGRGVMLEKQTSTYSFSDSGQADAWRGVRRHTAQPQFLSGLPLTSASPSMLWFTETNGCVPLAAAPYGDLLRKWMGDTGANPGSFKDYAYKLFPGPPPAPQWIDAVSGIIRTTDSSVIPANRAFLYVPASGGGISYTQPLAASVASLAANPLIDTDDDLLPDLWEVDQFGDIVHTTGSADLDGDDATNYTEYVNGTSPITSDSDGDGVTDGIELAYGLDPLDPADGLRDMDMDGLRDWWEAVHFGTTTAQDASGDPDGDEAQNLAEFLNNTNPLDSDTDDDLMPDGWEIAHGLDPLNALDAVSDPDMDHFPNLREYRLGNLPGVANVGSNYLPSLSQEQDADQDSLRDDWENQVVQSNASDGISSAADINPDEDLDGDMLTNEEEYANDTNPLDPSDGLKFEVHMDTSWGYAWANGFPALDGGLALYSTQTNSLTLDDDYHAIIISSGQEYDSEHVVRQKNNRSSTGLITKKHPIVTGQMIGSPSFDWDEVTTVETISASGEFNETLSSDGAVIGFRTITPNPVVSQGEPVLVTFQGTLWNSDGTTFLFNPYVGLNIMPGPVGAGTVTTTTNETTQVTITTHGSNTTTGGNGNTSQIISSWTQVDTLNLSGPISTSALIAAARSDLSPSPPSLSSEYHHTQDLFETMVSLSAGSYSVELTSKTGQARAIKHSKVGTWTETLEDFSGLRVLEEHSYAFHFGGSTPPAVLDAQSLTDQSWAIHSISNPRLPPIDLAIDANRDGIIVQGETGSPSKPFQFWTNEDDDERVMRTLTSLSTYTENEQDDREVTNDASKDCNNAVIDGERDLEDLARLWICTKGLNEPFRNGSLRLALKWTDISTGSPAIRVFKAAENDGGDAYLFTPPIASVQVDQTAATGAHGMAVGGLIEGINPVPLAAALFANLSESQPKTHLLFEGARAGKGQLKLVILDQNDQPISESSGVWIELKEPQEFVERYSCGDQSIGDVGALTHYTPSTTFGAPTTEAEKDYVLYVHGYNMEDWEKQRWIETTFKRLYWLGYSGRVGGFSWPCAFGLVDQIRFDKSEERAWQAGVRLQEHLLTLKNAGYRVHVVAHSQGNVVIGEALRLWRAAGNAAALVNTYIASQAAVAAHSYNATAPLMPEYEQTTPNVYAVYWQPGDSARFPHTWPATNPPYFADSVMQTTVGRWVNFYNPQDYALTAANGGMGSWEFAQRTKPDDLPPDHLYAWSPTNGFFKGLVPFETSYSFPDDRYAIFSFCAEARSVALGTNATGGVFGTSGVDLEAQFGYSRAHLWHSAQFRSFMAARQEYWAELLRKIGIQPYTP